ncbi:hypothetical protein AO371_0854 [Moraxella catarrhalis]|nr:hypothetical protein AO376_0322 [Moraxella catarrhalis]OAV16982.1 hypothetical protein AO374_1517 [Moraxella catarrhalis]OAV24625.1 hypothetical protein AO371_0854 [Moraxella catarrhalis]
MHNNLLKLGNKSIMISNIRLWVSNKPTTAKIDLVHKLINLTVD